MTADLDALLIEGSYHAIVSALAIHHLKDDGKLRPFKMIHAALKPGGVFVNAEQVAGATAAIERRYRESWLKRVRKLGVSENDLAGALEDICVLWQLLAMACDWCEAGKGRLLWDTLFYDASITSSCPEREKKEPA